MLGCSRMIICSVGKRDSQRSDGTFLSRCCFMSQLLVCCWMAHGDNMSDMLRAESSLCERPLKDRMKFKKPGGRCWGFCVP